MVGVSSSQKYDDVTLFLPSLLCSRIQAQTLHIHHFLISTTISKELLTVNEVFNILVTKTLPHANGRLPAETINWSH
jgi:hypothetical protein